MEIHEAVWEAIARSLASVMPELRPPVELNLDHDLINDQIAEMFKLFQEKV